MTPYRISRGLLRHDLLVWIEGIPPCLFCGVPVTRPSCDGPLVCPLCDMGRNPDGTPWTGEQATARWRHCREAVAAYERAFEH